jgi:hypothetical protein
MPISELERLNCRKKTDDEDTGFGEDEEMLFPRHCTNEGREQNRSRFHAPDQR